MFYKISSSVGSGKTQAVLERIRDNLGVGYILVAPTIELCNEIEIRLYKTLANNPEYSNNGPIHLVVSDDAAADGVYQRALAACQDFDKQIPPIVIVTTKTFEFLLDNLQDNYKSRYCVFVDEGLPSIKQVSFSPAERETFTQYLNTDETGLAEPAEGCKEILEWVAFSPNKLSGQQLDHLNVGEFRNLAELVLSDHYDTYVWNSGRQIEALGVLSPIPMRAFQSVTLIVAIFERTLLPRLWQQRFGIEFDDFPLKVDLYNAHTAKGPLISIWHALAQGDLPSVANMHRNAETGDRYEKDERKQVVYEAARQINERYPEGQFIWVANRDFKNRDDVLHGTRIPGNSSGLDHFKNFDNVVALQCINPLPWVKTRMKSLFDLEDDELYDLWRFSHTYQAVGRCSLRLRESQRPIEVVVPSSLCAEQLAKLFVGAEIKGQITTLRRYSKLTNSEKATQAEHIAFTGADNTAYSKYRKRCKAKGEVPLDKDSWFYEVRLPNLNR